MVCMMLPTCDVNLYYQPLLPKMRNYSSYDKSELGVFICVLFYRSSVQPGRMVQHTGYWDIDLGPVKSEFGPDSVVL